MNRRIERVLCLFLFCFCFSSGCTRLSFVGSKETPYHISFSKKSEKQFEVDKTADFYFLGYSPVSFSINLDQEFYSLGVEDPSFITVEQKLSLKSFFLTVLTLGLYCPLDYKISLLSNKEVKN